MVHVRLAAAMWCTSSSLASPLRRAWPRTACVAVRSIIDPSRPGAYLSAEGTLGDAAESRRSFETLVIQRRLPLRFELFVPIGNLRSQRGIEWGDFLVRLRDHGLRRAQLDSVRRAVAVAVPEPLELVEGGQCRVVGLVAPEGQRTMSGSQGGSG